MYGARGRGTAKSQGYKALKNQMAAILMELERIAAGDCVAEELLRTIGLIAATMNGIKGDNADD